MREWLALRTGDGLQELARDFDALVLRVAPQEDAWVLRWLAITHNERVRRGRWCADEVAVHLTLELP